MVSVHELIYDALLKYVGVLPFEKESAHTIECNLMAEFGEIIHAVDCVRDEENLKVIRVKYTVNDQGFHFDLKPH
jgi:uncharacterized protein YcgL (UPF0745 family)